MWVYPVYKRPEADSYVRDTIDFMQDGFAITDDVAPEVELCYPAYGCSERYVSAMLVLRSADLRSCVLLFRHLRFPLIVPRTTNEYNPIEDLKSAIEAMILGTQSALCSFFNAN